MSAEPAATMDAVREVCREILAGVATPHDGASRILDIAVAAEPLRFPELDTFIYAVSEWQSRPEDANIFAEGVMAAARDIALGVKPDPDGA